MALLRTSAAAPDHDDGGDGGKWWKEHWPKSNCRWTVGCYFKACCCLLLVLLSYFELLKFIISIYSVFLIFSFDGFGKKCSSHPWVATHNAEQVRFQLS